MSDQLPITWLVLQQHYYHHRKWWLLCLGMIYLAYVPTPVYVHQHTSRVYTECDMSNNQNLSRACKSWFAATAAVCVENFACTNFVKLDWTMIMAKNLSPVKWISVSCLFCMPFKQFKIATISFCKAESRCPWTGHSLCSYSVSVSVGFLLFNLPRNLDLLTFMHAVTVYKCHTPANKKGWRATDSCFALIGARQCGVLMDNVGWLAVSVSTTSEIIVVSTETDRGYQSKRDCVL